MGASTYTRLDRVVIARYFGFTVVSQLIIFTFIGVIYSEHPFPDTRISTHDGYYYQTDSVLELVQALAIQKVTPKIIFENLTSMIPFTL